MKKVIIIIMMFLVLVSIAQALECQPTMTPEEGENCTVTSTWNYTKPCTIHNVTVYNLTGNNQINFTFQAFGDSELCSFVWNISEKGSYNYLVSNGDTGNILIQESETMPIAFIIGVLGIATLLIYFAFNLNEDHFILKILLIIFSLITLLIIPAGLINGVDLTAPILLKVVYSIFGIFITYFSVFLFWHWAKKSEKFISMLNSFKRR